MQVNLFKLVDESSNGLFYVLKLLLINLIEKKQQQPGSLLQKLTIVLLQ